MEYNHKYDGVFCAEHIPQAILLFTAGLYLYSINIYFSIGSFILFFITITSLLKCKTRCPEHIATISNNILTINLPGDIKSIPVDSIGSVELKLNRLIVTLKTSKTIVIPGNYWLTTSDMRDFKDNIHKLLRGS